MIRLLPLLTALAWASTAPADPPLRQVSLTLEDQFDKRHDLKDHRGDVTVILYGDRKGTEANRALGERLYVHYHPAARGKPVAEARTAPVTPVAGLPAGARTPDVRIVAVACMGKAPELVVGIVKREIKKASPEVPVWLDAGTTMKDTFGMQDGEPNLVVIDAEGRLRYRLLGTPDEKTLARIVEVIDYLRREAAGVK